MWKKTLFGLLSVLVSLLGFYGVVRLGWTVESLVAAGLVGAFLVAGLLSGNEHARQMERPLEQAVVNPAPMVGPAPTVGQAPMVGQATELPELLDGAEDSSQAVTVESPAVTPIRSARTFEWGALPPVGTAGPSQF